MAKEFMEKETKTERKIASIDRYGEFRDKVKEVLEQEGKPLTWTEIRQKAGFAQKFPNNVWVRNMEKDVGLVRERIKGTTYWKLR